MELYPIRVTIRALTLYLPRRSHIYGLIKERCKYLITKEQESKNCNNAKSIVSFHQTALSLFNPNPETVSAEMRSNHCSTKAESVNEHQCKNMQTHAKPSLLFPYTNFALILLSLGFKLIKKEWEAGRISSGD
jgi:hypothetical protein